MLHYSYVDQDQLKHRALWLQGPVVSHMDHFGPVSGFYDSQAKLHFLQQHHVFPDLIKLELSWLKRQRSRDLMTEVIN